MHYGNTFSFTYVSFFIIQDVHIGLKKSVSQKARDHQHIKAKMLKCMEKEVHEWMSDIFNRVLQHAMPYNLNMN